MNILQKVGNYLNNNSKDNLIQCDYIKLLFPDIESQKFIIQFSENGKDMSIQNNDIFLCIKNARVWDNDISKKRFSTLLKSGRINSILFWQIFAQEFLKSINMSYQKDDTFQITSGKIVQLQNHINTEEEINRYLNGIKLIHCGCRKQDIFTATNNPIKDWKINIKLCTYKYSVSYDSPKHEYKHINQKTMQIYNLCAFSQLFIGENVDFLTCEHINSAPFAYLLLRRLNASF